MLGVLYKSKHGTPHIVRVVGKHREMLKGEKLDNTAHTYQVLAQRQKKEILETSGSGNYWTVTFGNFISDNDFDAFNMEEELFLSEYEELID